MQVSRELDYGIRAIMALAAKENEIFSKRLIAEEYTIPVNFLALILPKLARGGLVESLPGPRGGYRLAKPAKDISMFDVAAALDENFALNRCLDPVCNCERQDTCPARPFWKQLRDNSVDFLKGVTFDRMVPRSSDQ